MHLPSQTTSPANDRPLVAAAGTATQGNAKPGGCPRLAPSNSSSSTSDQSPADSPDTPYFFCVYVVSPICSSPRQADSGGLRLEDTITASDTMEPLGAVASVIAIGQALTALPRIVEVLRSMANTKEELGALLNEVILSFLSSFIRVAADYR